MAVLHAPSYDPLRTGHGVAVDPDEELAEVPGPEQDAPAPSRWRFAVRMAWVGVALMAAAAVSSACFAAWRHPVAGTAADPSHASGLVSQEVHPIIVSPDLRSQFAKIDENGDGKISQSEAITYAVKNGATADEAKKIFEKYDNDGDGQMDIDEFKSASRQEADSAVQKEGNEASALKSAMRSVVDHPFTNGTEMDPTSRQRIGQTVIALDKFQASPGTTRTAVVVGTSAGMVSGLYTIGCPSTAFPPLRNAQRPDGCFPGLRAINERLQYVLFSANIATHDPVTFVASLVGYRHALMPLMLLKSYDLANSVIYKCEGETEEAKDSYSKVPELDPYVWVDGHNPDAYLTFLGQQHYEPNSAIMAHFSAIAYNDDLDKVQRAFRDNGWNLVGAAQSKDDPKLRDDPVFLVQEPGSLDCTLVFRGTDSASDAITDINALPATFCGFADEEDLKRGDDNRWHPKEGNSIVHRGFKDELMRIVDSPTYIANIKSKLPKCNKTYVAGHSLGAALAELFTACVHKAPMEGDYGFQDYNAINWKPQAPERLEPVVPHLWLGKDSGQIEQEYHQCAADTGGTCRVMSCNAGRGETDCIDGKCLCKTDFCAFGGICVPKSVVEG